MPTLITRDYAVSRKQGYSTGTFYASIIGSLASQPAKDDAAMLQKRAGKLSKLRVYITFGGDPNEQASVTLLKKPSGEDWETTDLSINNTSGSTGLFEDNNANHAVNFSSGDLLCWEIVATGTALYECGLRYIVARVEDQ